MIARVGIRLAPDRRMTQPVTYHSRAARKETAHTVSLIQPHLDGCHSVLDVGCGAGYVARALAHGFPGETAAVDLADFRRVPTPHFAVFDGVNLPFEDDRFDVVVFSFVLHHVPDVYKALLLKEARRVARKKIFVLEDTPRTWWDRLFSWYHGESFRRGIRSRESFGFLDGDGWLRLFGRMQLRPVYVRRLSRLCRSLLQPFPRTVFVLDVEKPVADRALAPNPSGP